MTALGRVPGEKLVSLSMLGWALNEEESIAECIERAERRLSEVADDYGLIIIDDGNTEGTWEITTACQRSRPWLRLNRNERNRGPGYNTKRAIGLAKKDYLSWQIVDWAYDIRALTASLSLLAKYEVLQGVRLAPVSPTGLFAQRSDHVGKAVISVVNYLLIRFLFRLPLSDYQNSTVYPRSLIQAVELETESAFTNPECLLKAWWKGATIKEVLVSFYRAREGNRQGDAPRCCPRRREGRSLLVVPVDRPRETKG